MTAPGDGTVDGLAEVRRAIILGANGWFGRTAVDILSAAWGNEAGRRLHAFARRHHEIELSSGEVLEVLPISNLADFGPQPATLLIDCAYPTQEKVDDLGVDEYRRNVESLRRLVSAEIERLRPLACVSLSSGAAVAGEDAPERTRVYGAMKRGDEQQLAGLCPSLGVKLCIARIYAASGPHMTKPETYALGDLILQARDGGPLRVRASREVFRSYALASDILTVAMLAALGTSPDRPVLFETGGEEVEVGELARRVATVVAGRELKIERPPVGADPPDRYVGNNHLMEQLAARHEIELAGLDEQIRETADGL